MQLKNVRIDGGELIEVNGDMTRFYQYEKLLKEQEVPTEELNSFRKKLGMEGTCLITHNGIADNVTLLF